MASVFRRSGRLFVKWKDAHGRWRMQSTTARTKAEARRLAAELEQQAERQRLGLEPLERNPERWTLGDLLRWWLVINVNYPCRLAHCLTRLATA